MSDVWIYRWQVNSFTSDKTYTVALRCDGTFGCSCPAWKFHKAPKPNCRHILEVLRVEPKATRGEVERNSGKVFEVASRSVQKRVAVQKRQPMPTFTKPVEPEPEGFFVLQTRRAIAMED